MSSKVRIALCLLLIFGGGVTVGWVAGRWWPAPSALAPRVVPKTAEETLREMESRLRLRPAQVEQIGPVVTQWREDTRRIEQQALRQRFELLQRMVPVLRTNLGPLQRQAYDREVRRIEAQFREGLRRLESTPAPRPLSQTNASNSNATVP